MTEEASKELMGKLKEHVDSPSHPGGRAMLLEDVSLTFFSGKVPIDQVERHVQAVARKLGVGHVLQPAASPTGKHKVILFRRVKA